jgi:hypothetical protein
MPVRRIAVTAMAGRGYRGGMRYPDGGGGLSAVGRARWEKVRLQAAELFEEGLRRPNWHGGCGSHRTRRGTFPDPSAYCEIVKMCRARFRRQWSSFGCVQRRLLMAMDIGDRQCLQLMPAQAAIVTPDWWGGAKLNVQGASALPTSASRLNTRTAPSSCATLSGPPPARLATPARNGVLSSVASRPVNSTTWPDGRRSAPSHCLSQAVTDSRSSRSGRWQRSRSRAATPLRGAALPPCCCLTREREPTRAAG